MQLYFPDTPDLPLPDGHMFPATKYRLLRERLLAEGTASASDLTPSPLATDGELAAAHCPAYIHAATTGTLSREAQRGIGLPWSETLIARARGTIGGALAASRCALTAGVAGQLAGGTHHAHRDFGSGFCVFNDCAVVALTLLAEREVSRVAVLDLDVHQGDGNAAILGPDPRVFVASVHGANNFPFVKPPSDLDIGLPDGTHDETYLAAAEAALDAVLAFRPDLVLYIAGVDPLAEDRLGKLAVTMSGLEERDRRVLSRLQRAGVPVSIAIGGGYAEQIALTVAAYANTFRVARDVFEG